MRIARIALTSQNVSSIVYARIDNDIAEPLSAAPWADGVPKSGERPRVPFDASMLRCPVTPSKILCIGRNYAAHAKELGNDVPTEPLLFLKPPSSLLDPDATIVLPRE